MELARLIHATQRAISYYEVEATFPPAEAIVKLAKALRVSTDELLGLKRLREEDKDQDEQRLWKKFRQIRLLPEKDQRAVARMVNSLVDLLKNSAQSGAQLSFQPVVVGIRRVQILQEGYLDKVLNFDVRGFQAGIQELNAPLKRRTYSHISETVAVDDEES
jgi:transcriptional regulator with XRE-family HTH domain